MPPPARPLHAQSRRQHAGPARHQPARHGMAARRGGAAGLRRLAAHAGPPSAPRSGPYVFHPPVHPPPFPRDDRRGYGQRDRTRRHAPADMITALADRAIDGGCVGPSWGTEACLRGLGFLVGGSSTVMPFHLEKLLVISDTIADSAAPLKAALHDAVSYCRVPDNRHAIAQDLARPPEKDGLALPPTRPSQRWTKRRRPNPSPSSRKRSHNPISNGSRRTC